MRKSRPLGLRLYDRALVEILGQVRPQTAERDQATGVYRIGNFDYHENGTPLPCKPPAPPVLLVYSTGCTLARG